MIDQPRSAFEDQVSSLRDYLFSLRQEFIGKSIEPDSFDENVFLTGKATSVFPALDAHFDSLWASFVQFPLEEREDRRRYFERELYDLLGYSIETNCYIRQKPLGYAGDYVMMNYIYEYHDNKYLGGSLYSRLINRYTCNINVARSNIARKEYIKNAILQTLISADQGVFLSVGCGPAREILELLNERKISRATIHLLDLEKKAVSYVKSQLELIDYDRSMVDIQFHVMDLMDLIKNRQLADLFARVNLLYSSGVFDYLSDRVAKKVFARLFDITGRDLIVFNMSLEHARHRMYYEIFGDWVMYHRPKAELVSWGDNLKELKYFSVDNSTGCNSYWIVRAGKS